MLRFGWGTGGGYHTFSIFCSDFVLLIIVLSWLVYMIVCCVCFIVPFLLSLSVVPLIRGY